MPRYREAEIASLSYSEGIPDVAPDTQAPSDYQQIQPKAGAGLQSLGQGLSKSADFFNQAAADNAFNDYQSFATKLLYGDPNKTTPAPDGSSMPDTGYFGLKGRAALDGRPQVEKALDDKLDEIRQGLGDPQQIQQFETYSRRYRASYSADIGRHTDQQANVWYGAVNTAAGQNAIDAISANPLNPDSFLHSTSDLINARVKQAELNGAQKGDPVWTKTVAEAKRDAIIAQVNAVGTDDPSRALSILEKNRPLAGEAYDQTYNSLRARADQASGIAAGTDALTAARTSAADTAATSYANPSLPVYQQTVASIPGGMSAGGLARTVQIESAGNPAVENASGHVGLGQFSDETWKVYGNGGDPKNPDDAIAATQRYAAANSRYLTDQLGRPPTDVELYLAHQQGPGGAAKLLTNPDAPAASLIGTKAVIQNGGTQGMTAGQFVQMWAHKFNGTTTQGAIAPIAAVGAPEAGLAPSVAPQGPEGAAPEMPALPVGPPPAAPSANPLPSQIATGTPSAKAQAYQAIMDRTDLTPEAKQHAITYINQQLQAEAIAADATAVQKKQASDAKANTFTTQILSGGATPDILSSIANDPDLEWQTKESLTQAAMAHANTSVTGATASYGDGFWKAYQQVTAAPGDPSRLSDAASILRRAGPGGDLTLAGAQYLISTMGQVTRSVNDSAVADTQKSLMSYAKSKLSFQQDTGPLQIKDPEGEKLFNARFVPQFLSAYDKWTKDGNDPWEFLTPDNIDKRIAALRSPREMALAKMAAMQGGGDASTLVAPPPPANVDPDGWKLLLTSPPLYSGKPLAQANWQGIVQALVADPSPNTISWFDSHFSGSNILADDVLDILGVKKTDASKPKVGPEGGVVPEGVNPANYPGPNAVINGQEDVGLPMPRAQ